MQNLDDKELLQEFVRCGSEDAFAAIVQRHINLVHSAALRQVRDPALAAEVTQTVFIILAKKARSLSKNVVLSGWLYRTAQFTAARALRAEWRRQKHEQEAAKMEPELPDPHWEQIAPFLEEAMADLRDGDRNAVVLRYFENKDLKTVGEALGTNEDAARKRVTRAVEKLRAFFHKRGVRLSAVGVAGVLSANAVQAAPPVLVPAITTAATKGVLTASNGLLLKTTLKFMAWTKLKTAVVAAAGVLLAAGTVTVTVQRMQQPGSHARLSVMPDGSFIRLLSVLTGTNFEYQSKGPTAWQQKLIKYLPSAMASAYDGWLGTRGGRLRTTTVGGATNLAVIIARERPSRGRGSGFAQSDCYLVVLDDQGNAFEAAHGGGTIGNDDGKHFKTIEDWVLDACPRRSKTIGLRFVDSSSGTNRVLAEFRIANPLYANYPIWPAQQLPDTQTVGDLSVTLTSFTAGMVNAPRNLGGPNNPATHATFRYEQNGRTNTAWRPNGLTISDATGNLWMPFNLMDLSMDQPGELFIRGALWPSEPSVKLRIEFLQFTDFPADETCTFRAIKVPSPNETNTPDLNATINGVQVRVVAFTGTNADQPGTLQWLMDKGTYRISIRATPMPQDSRLGLAKVIDNQGREVPFTASYDFGLRHSNEKVFALKLQPDATSVDCTFALSKSRYVEFVAKPEIVPAK